MLGIVVDVLLILSGSLVLQPYIASRVPALGAYLEKAFVWRAWLGFILLGLALLCLIPAVAAIFAVGLLSLRILLMIVTIVVAVLLGTIEGLPLLEQHVKPTLGSGWVWVEKIHAFAFPYYAQLAKAAVVLGVLGLLLLL